MKTSKTQKPLTEIEFITVCTINGKLTIKPYYELKKNFINREGEIGRVINTEKPSLSRYSMNWGI